VLFVFDPTQKSLDHVREFLGNSNCIRIAENTDQALALIRRSPFDFNMVILNVQPHANLNHDHNTGDDGVFHGNEYFLKEISRLGHLSGVPVIAVSDDPTLKTTRPLTAICPSTVTVPELYQTASRLLEGRHEQKKQMVM
jgi:hypothetical protein